MYACEAIGLIESSVKLAAFLLAQAGAAIGACVGGPVGAAVGGIVGGVCWRRYWIWVGEDGCGQGQWLGPWLISLTDVSTIWGSDSCLRNYGLVLAV